MCARAAVRSAFAAFALLIPLLRARAFRRHPDAAGVRARGAAAALSGAVSFPTHTRPPFALCVSRNAHAPAQACLLAARQQC
jgi:hypothetical protein